MTTATKSPTTAIPTRHGLEAVANFPLDRNASELRDDYHRDCNEFLASEGELQADWQQLTADGLDMVVGDVVTRRDELVAQKQSLEEVLTRLRWQFVDVLPKLLPSAKAAVANAQRLYDQTLAEQIADFAEQGITRMAMPAHDVNPDTAQHQLTFRAKQETVVLSAQEEVNKAECDLRVLKSQMGIPVSPERCRINLPIPAGTHDAVRRLLA